MVNALHKFGNCTGWHWMAIEIYYYYYYYYYYCYYYYYYYIKPFLLDTLSCGFLDSETWFILSKVLSDHGNFSTMS